MACFFRRLLAPSNPMFARAELLTLSAPPLIPPSYFLTNTKQFFAFLCFHALTNCPVCKSFFLMTIQQWGVPPSSHLASPVYSFLNFWRQYLLFFQPATLKGRSHRGASHV